MVEAFHPKCRSGCSIRSSRRRTPGRDLVCPSPRASCRVMAGCWSIKPRRATARPSELFCRRLPAMLTRVPTEPAQVLLIEDDPGISDTLRRVLAQEGYRVAVERRGDDGLARAAKDAFDLVISDLKLPGMNGLELVRQL